MFSTKDAYGGVYNHIMLAQDTLERVRLAARKYATQATGCKVAKNIQAAAAKQDRSRLRRALATSDTRINWPFYAMTYTTLTKVLLDYRLQQAADQFCKYYEFRGGGIPPPMCISSTQGSTRPYYSLSKIGEMRSWQPAVYPRITSRILIPTQPAGQLDTGLAYPYVDLVALGRGEAVNFDVPLWDFDWLKRYLWVPSNAKPDTLASYYVESMRLYLPIEARSGFQPTVPLAATVYADSSFAQFANWQQRGRLYQLPPQTFQFDVAFNMPVCPTANRAINPYHESADCVSTNDRSSQICVTQEATESSPRLLPNLFSSWRFRADFDSNNAQFRLLAPLPSPANASNSLVEFNLFADVTLVRVTASVPRSISSIGDESVPRAAAASSCCARDEFRNLQTSVCTKCPEGTVAALNGYTCATA